MFVIFLMMKLAVEDIAVEREINEIKLHNAATVPLSAYLGQLD